MTDKFDQYKEEAFAVYNKFMETLSDKDKITITRFISSILYNIQNRYVLMDPIEVLSIYRNSTEWRDSVKDLFRQYHIVIKEETVDYATVSRVLDLDRFETPPSIEVTAIVSYHEQYMPTGGKIHFSEDQGIILCVIPSNSVLLSTFVLAHEVAHLVISKLGVDAIAGNSHGDHIGIEMLCDYFAIFVYCRLTHISDKKQHKNLSEMLGVISCSESLYNTDEMQIRELHLKSVLDTLNLI